jgi:hypothetical protein
MVPSASGKRPGWETFAANRSCFPKRNASATSLPTANRRPAPLIPSLVSRYSKALLAAAILFPVALSCGGGDICDCNPQTPVSQQYRSAAKHIRLPDGTPQDITVSTMLQWPQSPNPDFHAARTGRELQLFHIHKAYLQNLGLDKGDCDLHFSISDTPDKNAPRAIVETPVDAEYCSARRVIQSQLAQHGITLDADHGGELATPLPVQVVGLAFHDFNHDRPRPFATTWELHPAIITLLK